MRRLVTAAAILPLLLLGTSYFPSGHATVGVVEWNGDYQTGDFSQWDSLSNVTPPTIVTSPVRAGYTYAAKYVVNPGDHTDSQLTERSEANTTQTQAGGFEGRDEWYGWSTYFPSNLNPPPNKTTIFTQFHQTQADISQSCPPNIAFQIDAHTTPPLLRIRVRGGNLDVNCNATSDVDQTSATLTSEVWHDFLVHIQWSDDAALGSVKVWMDGVQVMAKTHIATLYTGEGVYMKQGLYRPNYALTSTIYHTATKRGTTAVVVTP